MLIKKITTLILTLGLALLFACDDDSDKDKSGGIDIPTDGLIHYYSLDGHARDDGPEPCDGMLNGAIATIGRTSVDDTALSFDGDASVDLTFFDVPENCTVSFWFRTAVMNGSIISWSEYPLSPGSDSMSIRLVDGTLTVSTGTGPIGGELSGTTDCSDDSCTHGVITIAAGEEETTCQVIVNGAVDADGTIYSGLTLNTLKIGSGFTGAIDDVAVYDRVLSGTEIGQLHFD